MLDYLLPIGSVVRLKEGSKRLMIYGVKQTNADTGIVYDYVGVLYPQGHMGQQFTVLFNHDLIEEVTARGYEDEEWEDFKKVLTEVLTENEEES